MKTALQKMYEKNEMLNRSADLHTMLAKRDTGEWAMFTCVNQTPLARLMNLTELQRWVPHHENSDKVSAFCREWAEKDTRHGIEFDEYGPEGMEAAFKEFASEYNLPTP